MQESPAGGRARFKLRQHIIALATRSLEEFRCQSFWADDDTGYVWAEELADRLGRLVQLVDCADPCP
ncbi:MAG TPA: hypothetical protein VGL99_14095 [Chloroflexota bacterium]